jgi:hypothetical protein
MLIRISVPLSGLVRERYDRMRKDGFAAFPALSCTDCAGRERCMENQLRAVLVLVRVRPRSESNDQADHLKFRARIRAQAPALSRLPRYTSDLSTYSQTNCRTSLENEERMVVCRHLTLLTQRKDIGKLSKLRCAHSALRYRF